MARRANWQLILHRTDESPRRALVRHYRVDQDHSNSYTVWKRMNSPQQPTLEQYKELEAAGKIARYGDYVWLLGQQRTISYLPLAHIGRDDDLVSSSRRILELRQEALPDRVVTAAGDDGRREAGLGRPVDRGTRSQRGAGGRAARHR